MVRTRSSRASAAPEEDAGRDPYRSRVDPQWSFAARVDPVRWGETPGPLSEEQLGFYEGNGFLFIPGLFTPTEVVGLIEASRLATAALAPGADERILEPDSEVVRSIFRVHRTSEVFRGLAADLRLASVARQLLGSEVYIHQSRVNFKPGFDGREFYWHSDFETWHVEDGMPRMRALSVSILLTENTPVNGPLMLIPGSHHRYVRCVGETPAEHYKESLRSQRYGVPDREALRQLAAEGGVEQVTGPAGSVVFFDCNTMHGSVGNLSPSPRHNVFLVYNSVHNRLRAPYGGTEPRPEFLAEREAVTL